MTGRDLERVSVFLYETLGRWYELSPDGTPPAIEPPDIIIRPRTAAEQDSSASLLDPGDELEAAASTVAASDGDSEDDGGEDGVDEDEDEGESGSTPDERDGVFAASASLAQVAIGRLRTDDDESWDDVILQLETDQRPALASALWVGLATQPEARYPSIGQWRRSVDAALRSDAATADLVDATDRPRRAGLIVAAAAVLVAVAAGAFLLLHDGTTAVEDAGVAATEPEGPTTEETGRSTSTPDTTTLNDTAGSAGTDATDDPCAQSGPVGPVTIDQVSDTAIVVAWAPSTEAVDILLDGAFVDTVPAEAFRYVIERLPLSDDPLTPDTDYTVAVEPQSGQPSTACATTLAAPVPGSEFLIGVTAPTGFEVVDTSATSISVAWDQRLGADLHNLYLNGAYVRFGDVGGSSAIGDETEFTFVDLEPDTSYEIGIRRVEGPNQSGLVTITASTDPQ